MPDLSHAVWEWIGVLMVGGPCVGGLLWAWREIAREARRRRDAEAAANAWRAEAERLDAELKQREALARRPDPLDHVLTAYRVTDGRWERAS